MGKIATSRLAKWDGYRVELGSRVRLDRVDASATEHCADKEEAHAQLRACREQINALLAVLAAEEQHSVLVILQGTDASGKDGAIRNVFTGINPQHCRVVNFKEPSSEERAHDYLWRVYREVPLRGELCVFNRSQYEDVLVPLARGELSKADSRRRMRQIADLERIWAENGMTILKFFLHIGPEEQERRFRKRLEDPDKHWKVKPSDFHDRKLWRRFQSTYEDVLHRTSIPEAPWFILPAEHKWYRDLAIATLLLRALRRLRPRLPHPKLNEPKLRGELSEQPGG